MKGQQLSQLLLTVVSTSLCTGDELMKAQQLSQLLLTVVVPSLFVRAYTVNSAHAALALLFSSEAFCPGEGM